MQELSSFAPRLLVSEFSPTGAALREPALRRVQAVVMFADISGFTALTERLAARGPAGVEELTRVLNLYFGGLIDTVTGGGGDILKFAGDALLALWPLRDRDAGAEVARVADCGIEVQRVFSRLQAQDARLSVRVGIGAGPLSLFVVGGAAERWELVGTGDALRQIGDAAHLAQPGHVLLSAAARQLAAERVEVEPVGDAFRLLSAASPPAVPVAHDLADASPQLLRSFVPDAVVSHLERGGTDWLGEMRRVSVMFVHFPGLHYETPIERAQAVMSVLQRELSRQEGTVNKLSVDDKGAALLAAFGLPPLAHEDDAARAVAAGLAIQDHLRQLQVRHSIGIATGQAFCGVVGNTTRREYTVIGDVVNLGARLMQAAGGEILCDERTQESARTRSTFTALAPVTLKGKAQPLNVYRPEPAGGAAHLAELPMVGRADELKAMRERIGRLTGEGVGGLIVLEAGPGIGKSRLASAFLDEAAGAGAVVLRGAALAVENATPFFAWRELFEDLLDIRRVADPAARRARVHGRVAGVSPDDVALLPLLNPVVLTDFPETEATAALRDQARGGAAMALLGRLLGLLPEPDARKAVLLEDAHWFDSASWLLVGVAHRVPGLLLLATTRPLEAIPGVAELDASTLHLRLQPLGGADAIQLVCNRLGVASLPEPVADLIRARSEGNPLFAEELAYALRDSGALAIENGGCRLTAADLSAFAIPSTVQAAMTGRIDRLPVEEQLTLKTASVIGRVFVLDALREVCPLGERTSGLPEILSGLVDRDLLHDESALDATYAFKHAVLQDVAYGLMLGAQRRQLHRAVAEWLESQAAAGLRGRHAALAYHWSRVLELGDTSPEALQRALDCNQRAGEEAVAAFAHREAAGFLQEALRLLERLPDTPERSQREFGLQMTLGPVMIVTRGWAAAETERAFGRAWELCRHSGSPAMQAPILYGIWNFHVGSARMHRARELAHELLALAESVGDPALLGPGHRALSEMGFWMGDFESGIAHCDLGARFYDPAQAERELRTNGVHSAVVTMGFEAWLAWQLGDSTRARDAARRQMTLALELKHPFCIAIAHMNNALLYQFLGEADRVRSLAESLTRLAREHGLLVWVAGAAIMLGWALVESGQIDAGVAEAERGIAAWQATGADLAGPYYFSLLAAGFARAGQPARALELLERGIAQAERSGEVWWLAELLRLRAEYLAPGPAEASLRRALDVARSQKARFLALRAACSLAELLGDQTIVADQLSAFPYPADSPEARRAHELLGAGPSQRPAL